MNQVRERFLVDEHGNRVAVLLDIDDYEQLLEAVAELADIAAFDAALASGEEAIPFRDDESETEARGR